METKVGIISDQVTPIHLCETLELVSKKLVSEYLLYFENCADNATLTFSFHGKQLILLIGMFKVVSVSGVGRSYQKCTHWGFGVFHSRYRGTGSKPI
jgi:hypothetical protein